MKSIAAFSVALASAAQAHYTFPYYVDPTGNVTGEWEYVRETANHYSNSPVTDVNSTDIACYQLATGDEGAKTGTVTAGDTVGLKLDSSIGHPGPLQWYMAKAPSGGTAASMTGSDSDLAWFKIAEEHPTVSSSGLTWSSSGQSEVNVTIPSCLEDGQYLLRVEHIALHGASTYGGAQFYLSCTQLDVTGGGSYTASDDDSCAFPGCYTGEEDGILINLYYPVPTTYTNPGPTPMSCSGSGSSSGSSSSAVVTSAPAATSTLATSVASAASGSATGSVAAADNAGSSDSCSKRRRRSQNKKL